MLDCDWAPFEYCYNNFVISKYTNPYQFLLYARDNNFLGVKIYHEIPNIYLEQAFNNSCLYFGSVYSHRKNRSKRADPNEMKPSEESLNNRYNFWAKIAEEVEGLDKEEIGLIGRKNHFIRENESQMHWFFCWSTEQPINKDGYTVIETTIGEICDALRNHSYDNSTENSLGEFKVGFIHYKEHKKGDDIIEDIFTKPLSYAWEKEFRICFHPSNENPLTDDQRNILFYDNVLRPYLEIPLDVKIFKISEVTARTIRTNNYIS